MSGLGTLSVFEKDSKKALQTLSVNQELYSEQ